MTSRNNPTSVSVPIIVPVPGNPNNTLYVRVQKLLPTKKRVEVLDRARVVVVGGEVFVTSGGLDPVFGMRASSLGVSLRDIVGDTGRLKFNTRLTMLAAEAFHLFGGTTAAQYRESKSLLIAAIREERKLAMASQGEDMLYEIVNDGFLTLAQVKKLVDKRVREEKQRKAMEVAPSKFLVPESEALVC